MQPEQFAAHARVEERHWWFTGRRTILTRVIGAVAGPGTAIADVGCGTGGNAAALAGAGYAVLGLDPSAEAIALARERFPDVAFRETGEPAAAAAHLSRGGLALMSDVLEHVADDRALLAAAIDVLPPGGHLLLTVPADPGLWSRHDEAFGHHRRYRQGDLVDLWRDLPVDVRLFSAFNARLRPVVMLHRRLFGHRRRPGGDLDVPVGPLNRVLHGTFAGEASALVRAIDRDRAPWRRGVSLMALLRRK